MIVVCKLKWLAQQYYIYLKQTLMEFEYIKNRYNVPADMFREVIVADKRGVIIKDMGNYIGVCFYDNKNKSAQPCHPTWEVEYLETFNNNPPKNKNNRSKQRYAEYKEADWFDGKFGDWLKRKK